MKLEKVKEENTLRVTYKRHEICRMILNFVLLRRNSACCLVDLPFDSEDGGRMFLRNVRKIIRLHCVTSQKHLPEIYILNILKSLLVVARFVAYLLLLLSIRSDPIYSMGPIRQVTNCSHCQFTFTSPNMLTRSCDSLPSAR
jgi:hypothetical protein